MDITVRFEPFTQFLQLVIGQHPAVLVSDNKSSVHRPENVILVEQLGKFTADSSREEHTEYTHDHQDAQENTQSRLCAEHGTTQKETV